MQGAPERSSGRAADGARDRPPSLLSVLRHTDFRLLWGANLLSGCGIWMQNLAQGWLILKLSDSSFLLGLAGFASLVPTLLLSLVGGTIADRVDRRRVLIATQCALMTLALLLAALTGLGVVRPWQIIGITLLTGVATALNSPAYQAMIPDLVPKEDLTRAIALNGVQFNTARIVGHSVAGVVVAAAGELGCFLFNGVSYAAPLWVLARMATPSRHRTADPQSFWMRYREGIVHLRADRGLRSLIATAGCISLLGLPYFFLLPAFGRDVLHGGPKALGYLTASVSVGALSGAFVLPRLAARWTKQRILRTAGVLFWVHLFGFSQSRIYWVSLLLLGGLGLTLVLSLMTINNLLQLMTRPEMRGRVMAVNGMAVNGLAPLGSLLAGAIAQVTSAPAAVGVMAALGMALTIVATIKLEPQLEPR
jgi:MFS family permease